MPINKTIAAELYHGLVLISLVAPLAAAPAQPKPASSKSPSPVRTSAAPVQGTFPTRVTEEQFSRTVASGIELTTITRRDANGPLQLFVTRVNLRPENSDVRWKLRLATADYSVLKRATVTAMSKKQNAVVAINGGYFAFGGAALGAVKMDGEWIRLPIKNRTSLGFDEKNGAHIGNLKASATVFFNESLVSGPRPFDSIRVDIDNLNGYAPENGTCVLTPRFGNSYKLREDEMAVEVENNAIFAHKTAGIASISAKGWTLIARGTARATLHQSFAETPPRAAKFQISAPASWQKFSNILGAGPRLLRNGKIETTETIEGFRPDVLARGPRSAVGVDAAGQVWLLAADGRDPEYSRGLTLSELAAEMKKLGVVEAICLDGGGSTAMTINGILVNRPSDGKERRVPNALIVTAVETSGK